MKHYYKETKTVKAMNTYLCKIGLEGFSLDGKINDYPLGEIIDHDAWIEENVHGCSVQLYRTKNGIELFANKYKAEDLKDY